MTQYMKIVTDKRAKRQPGREPLDLRNHKFGKLKAIDIVETEQVGKGKNYHWYCNCDCGTEGHIVRASDLQSNHTRSCGCMMGKMYLTKVFIDTKN